MNATAGGEIAVDSAWRTGSLSAHSGRQALLFGRVYEDSAIEQRAFSRGGRVFCIASAGCTALALGRDHDVVACDINPAQIAYVERRLAGGARELGSVERIMGFMRRLMPLAGWSRAKLGEFLALDAPERQLAFWRAELDTWRFRTGLALLLSPLWLRGWYSPALLASLPPRFDRVLCRRMQRCFARHANRTNPFAHALLSGFDTADVEGEPTRGARLALHLVVGDAAQYLERCPPRSFSGFSLSNILDGAGPSYRARLFGAIRRAARPEASVVLRSFSEPPVELRTNQAEEDRSMLWGVVDVRTVESLES